MLSDDIKKIVDQYFDGELDKSKETFLFSELSVNEESRKYFKLVNKYKNAIQETCEEFPTSLERKIFSSVRGISEKPYRKSRLFPLLSYSLALVLLIIGLFMFLEVREYRKEIQLTSRQMIEQQKTINLLINSLPPVEIETELKNAVIVKANL